MKAVREETFKGGIVRFSRDSGVTMEEIRLPDGVTQGQANKIMRKALQKSTDGILRRPSKSELRRRAVQRDAEATRRKAEEDKLAAEIAEAANWAVLHGGKHARVITHALNEYLGGVICPSSLAHRIMSP